MCYACSELIHTFLMNTSATTNVYLHYLNSKVPTSNSLSACPEEYTEYIQNTKYKHFFCISLIRKKNQQSRVYLL